MNNLQIYIDKLINGEIVCISCDTLYGFISWKKDQIYEIKKREKNKKLILLISKIGFMKIDKNKDQKLIDFLKQVWPKEKITVIYKNQGFRIPENPNLIFLINFLGPLWSSSANISGKPTITHLKQINDIFSEANIKINVLDDNYPILKTPSIIYNYDTKQILRSNNDFENTNIFQLMKSLDLI